MGQGGAHEHSPLTEELWTVSWWLLTEDKSVFFKSVTLGKSTKFHTLTSRSIWAAQIGTHWLNTYAHTHACSHTWDTKLGGGREVGVGLGGLKWKLGGGVG